MKNYLIYLFLFFIVLTSYSNLFAQNPFPLPQEGISTPAARILAEITLGGVPLSADDYIAAREGEFGNIVGTAIAFIPGGGPFAGRSFINFSIFGDANGVDQLSEGECFTFEVYDKSANEFLVVSQAPDPCDPRTCDNSGCTQTSRVINLINVSTENSASRGVPTMFGGFANQGAPTSPMPNWTQSDAMPGGNLEILPVIYSSISLSNQNCKQVSFDWTTSSEINNDGFYVERRVEGARTWESLEFLEGEGNSYEEVKYSYRDSEITEDKSLKVVYYRLKQVDFDGRIEYSEVQSVRLNCGNTSYINVFPNPVEDFIRLTLNHDGLRKDVVEFNVFSMNGSLVQKFSKEISDKDLIQWNGSHYSAGIYQIQAITEREIIAHTRFVKN